MRLFPVPMELTEEEKTIGGAISIRQAVYILGAVTGAVLFYIVLKAIGIYLWLCIILAMFIFLIGIVISFGRIKDISVDKYLCLWFMYYLRRKIFCSGDD